MGLHENYRKVSDLRDYMRKQRYEEHKYKSRIRLGKALKKKFETCFIGSLDSMENTFGELWGKGLDKSQRTQEQVKMLRLWLALRNEILDKGNAQLRGAIKELEEYEIDYQGKKIIFNVGDDE